MKKKDIIIYCIIILGIFIITSLVGVELPVIIIGILGFTLYLWAYSKWEDQLVKKIADEVKKKDEEQSIERITTELEKLQKEKDDNQK